MKLNPQKCSFEIQSNKILGYIVSARRIEAIPDQIQTIGDIAESKTSKDVMNLNRRVAALDIFISKATDKCITFFNVIKKKKNFERGEDCQKAFKKLKDHFEKPSILSSPVDEEIFYLYMVVSEHAISSVLMRGEENLASNILYQQKTQRCRN